MIDEYIYIKLIYKSSSYIIYQYIYIYIFFNIYPQDPSECGEDPIIEILVEFMLEYERQDQMEEEEEEQDQI